MNDLGAVSLRALNVDGLPPLSRLSAFVMALIRPQRPTTASRSGTASSPALCSTGRRTNTPWHLGHVSNLPIDAGCRHAELSEQQLGVFQGLVVAANVAAHLEVLT